MDQGESDGLLPDRGEFDRLYAMVYAELCQVAHHRLRSTPTGTLNTVELVHEVWLKLAPNAWGKIQDQAHFFRLAARAMRQILVERARARSSAKRGGGRLRSDLDLDDLASSARATELVLLDDALSQLEGLDSRQSRVVELRFFIGLSVDETAQILSVSPTTVKREWRKAKLFLDRELRG